MASILNIFIRKFFSHPHPPIAAALGMLLSYYAYQYIFSWIILLFIIGNISLLRVLRLMQNNAENVSAMIKKLGITCLSVAVGFCLGIAARGMMSSSVEFGLLPDRIVSVSGILVEDPRTLHGGSGLGILELVECGSGDGSRATASGRLSVFFPNDSIEDLMHFGRGAGLYLEGRLSPASHNSGINGYVFNSSSVHILSAASPLESFRTGLRSGIIGSFRNRQGNYPPVWAALASALLLGVRDDLDVTLSAGFRNSGASHILALSGMHLAIISGLLAFLFKKPFGLKISSLIGAAFIIIYVFIAGSQPSLVRAALMYLLGVFAIWTSLKINIFSVLSIAFILQLLFQSNSGESLSFILSYLAFFGMISLGNIIHRLLKGRLPVILSGSISVSLGAFIMTAPIVAYYFDSLRPIGVISCLFLAPLTSLFMLFSIFSLLVVSLPFPLWELLDVILEGIYRLIEFFISILGLVPGINVSNALPVLIFTIVFFILISFLTVWDEERRKRLESFY